jgi:fatty acid desaturase
VERTIIGGAKRDGVTINSLIRREHFHQVGFIRWEESMSDEQATTFSPSEARKIVGDLFRPEPAVYWVDFLVSLAVGYTAAAIYLQSSRISPVSVTAFFVAVLALYRLSLFMHEIVHFKRHEMRGFKVCWNVLAGIPMLTPSFFYESHTAHHNTHHYGTEKDGEYLPLAHGTWRDVTLFLLQVFVQPVLVCLRFLLTPVTFLRPAWRRWTLERASSFVINFRYRRELPANSSRAAWAAMDVACSMRAWAIILFVLLGINPWTRVLQLYSLAVAILAINHFRTLAAHLYRSNGGRMTHTEQLLDSTVITGGWLTELICPVGLRYHALHHLFPSLPYHNMAEAHRRLMANLPAGSAYHQVVFPSFYHVLREFCARRPEPVTSRNEPARLTRNYSHSA